MGGGQANLIGGTLHSFGVLARETDSRCHFERLAQSARHWHWNEEEIPSQQQTQRYTQIWGMWLGGMQQRIRSDTFSSLYLSLSIWHAVTALRHYYTHTQSEKEANYEKTSCHVSCNVSYHGVFRLLKRRKRGKKNDACVYCKTQTAGNTNTCHRW